MKLGNLLLSVVGVLRIGTLVPRISSAPVVGVLRIGTLIVPSSIIADHFTPSSINLH